MNKDNINSIPAQLAELLQRKDDEDASAGTITLTPLEAQYVIDFMTFPRHRGPSKLHCRMFADAMINGEFMLVPGISFLPMTSGQMVLVDGQHRYQAAVIAGETRKWLVRVVWTQSAEQIHQSMDRLVRPRTRGDAARSIDYEGLDPKTTNIVLGAAHYLLLWDPEYELPELCNRPPDRDCIAQINERIDAVRKAEQLLSH